MKRKILTSIFFIFVYICLYSNNSYFYKSGELTSNLINGICQDNKGYIWISTEYGLNKFDGVQFTQYLHEDNNSTSLLNNTVRYIFIDNNKILWIGCSNGLQYYMPNKDAFKTINFSNNIHPNIKKIIQIHNGKIWIITSGHGVFEFDSKNQTLHQVNLYNKLFISNQIINDFYEDHLNQLWIATEHNGVYMIDSSYLHIRHYDITKSSTNVIKEDENGNIYIGSGQNIMRFNVKDQTFYNLEKKNIDKIDIHQINHNKIHNLYISTFNNGLYYMNKDKNYITHIQHISTPFLDIKTSKIASIIEDKKHNIWIGLFQKGLLMIPTLPTSFGFLDFYQDDYNTIENDIENQGIVSCVYKDENRYVIGALEDKGLFEFNNNGKIIKHIQTDASVKALFRDSNNKLWVSIYCKGLASLNLESKKFNFIPELKDQYIKSITEDNNKNLYVGLMGGGIKRFDLRTMKESKICEKNPKSKQFLDNQYINVIICGKDDLIWIGHYVGISCYDAKNDCFLDIKKDSILQSSICYSLIESKDGTLWIGTNNGLFSYNKSKKIFKRYSTKNGLSNNMICGIAEDKEGNIWCSTFRGINKLAKYTKHICNFYTGDGLVDKEYIRGMYYQDNEGIIYFGGSSGITFFSPEEKKDQPFNNKVIITKMFIGNQAVNTNTRSGKKHVINTNIEDAENFYLSNDDNTFTFDFSTMDFHSPENIYYKYRLKELGKEWSLTQLGINQITYNHLFAGNYTFEVQAYEDGSYSPIKQIHIFIAPPWYKSIFAYIIYLIIISTIVFELILILKKKHLENINETKIKLFIDIAHEIRSPMTMIINPLNSLISDKNDSNTSKALLTMQENANRIIGLINQLLDIRKIDKGQMALQYSNTNIISYINELSKAFIYRAEKHNINFTFEHSSENVPLWIDRRYFDKIILNLLSNAFKFTPDNGEIQIILNTNDDITNNHFIEIIIQDSGLGIDKNKLNKIFERFYQVPNSSNTLGFGIGLNFCYSLVKLHHGTIKAVNRKDRQGSRFIIRMPVGSKHLKKEEILKEDPNYINSYIKKSDHIIIEKNNSEENNIKSKTHYKVLLIDDDVDLLLFLKNELKTEYKIDTCENGEEGLKNALQNIPDIIISDIKMPKMDGFTLLKKIKSKSIINHIPVILLTSETEHFNHIKGLSKGADGYINKPFDIIELKTLIKNLIENRARIKGKYSEALQENKIKPIDVKSNNNVLIERVMKVINDNLDNSELNVEMLSKQVGLSRVQLYRKLKEITGLSAGEYIRNIRLKQAAKLLKEKKINISQVSYMVGFNSQSHFTTAFKNFYGMTPSEYIESES